MPALLFPSVPFLSHIHSSFLCGFGPLLHLARHYTEATSRRRLVQASRAATTIAARDALRRLGVHLRPAPQRTAAEAERRLRTARDVANAVANMRGVAIKLAQMASYVDPELPEELRNALARFRDDAPPMDPELALWVIQRELGERARLFAELDEEPAAAASIGQVHRGRLRDGTTVAVKVQYPDARAIIEADLANAPALFGLLGLAFPAMRADRIANELSERIREELDYRHEAAVQARFARAYADHPRIVVPRPIPHLTTASVLTSEWVEGAALAQARTLSDEARTEIGEILFRFVFESLYRLHLYNGDPHPGNYLLLDGPRVAFLDFGFSRSFSAEEMAVFERLVRAHVLESDRHAFAAAARAAGLVIGSATDEEIWEFFAPFYELVAERGPRAVTEEYAASLVRRTFDHRHPVASAIDVPPPFVVVQRINLGLYSLLAELGATADWRAIAEEIWPFVAAPPATRIGREEAAWRAERAR
jgi:predicted unusual protein kinase regulating ubiquinone biosynthesis (AarF/ABC1/UbiB family)